MEAEIILAHTVSCVHANAIDTSVTSELAGGRKHAWWWHAGLGTEGKCCDHLYESFWLRRPCITW